jgi:hypothetical protein
MCAFGVSMPSVVRGGIHTLDRVAQRAQVLEPRCFELGIQGRHPYELKTGVVQARARLDRAWYGRHGTPELAAEVL